MFLDAIWIQRFTDAPRFVIPRIVSDLLMSLDHLRRSCRGGRNIVASAECERERFHAEIKKLDLELSISLDGAGPPCEGLPVHDATSPRQLLATSDCDL